MNISNFVVVSCLPLRVSLLAIIIAFCSLSKLHAQDIPFPFDGEGNYMSINAELESRLGIFPEYPNLIDARMFRVPDSTFVLEITQLVNDSPQRRRIPIDLAKLTDIRSRFATAFRKMFFDGEMSLTGLEKTSTVIVNTLLGLGYGLINLNTSQSRDFQAANALFPLVLGGGTLWAVQQPWFNRSSLAFLENGLTIGVLHGYCAYGLFGNQNATAQGFLVTGVVTGVAESIAGMYMADRLRLNYGQTTVITNIGTTGLISGVGLNYIFLDQTAQSPPTATAYSAAALIGSGAGFYAGYLLSQGQRWGNGDGLVFGALSPLGLLAPLGTTLLGAPTLKDVDPKILVGFSLATHLGSYLLGNVLVHNKDFTFTQGVTIVGATVVGMLASFGAFLVAPSDVASQYLPSLAVLGGALGFGFSYGQLAKQAEVEAQINSSPTETSKSRSSNFSERTWLDGLAQNTQIEFSPLGVIALGVPALIPARLSLPIVSLRHTFQPSNEIR